jgi:adenine-specific DNA-methyltransferase
MRWGFDASQKRYVVETNIKVIERCLLMTTDPGDLVLDPTCGSGTTAFVAEKWGRRWITCDTSRVALTLAKQRLMTASYDYYDLKYPLEGVKGGFIYKTVPHITLKSIANNPEIDDIYGEMHPAVESALAALNTALKGLDITYKITDGGRKGKAVEFTANDSQTMKLPSGETVPANALLEWEVPFDFPGDWPESAKKPFEAFHKARQAMQKKMDDTISAHADPEILYDQPQISKTRLRITGPFTVEAVPFPTVLRLEEADQPENADAAVARSGETFRQAHWRDELLKTGIRGKGGQILKLADLESLPGCRYIHAVGIVADSGDRVAVSFGPEHAALEQRQVEIAMREAGELFPLPKMLVFCAFTFDPEAAKDIDNIKGIAAIKVHMNIDLMTDDLKKKRSGNESFWLMGQPDVELRALKDGGFQVEVHGFDYFDVKTGELVSGGKHNIAMWELDTDYDDRSLVARQVFFPMAGSTDGWHKLKKDIKAELDPDRLQQFHGTVSLPFEAGENRRIAVKIIDDRGIESLKVMDLM